jgi:hypothetical protein
LCKNLYWYRSTRCCKRVVFSGRSFFFLAALRVISKA